MHRPINVRRAFHCGFLERKEWQGSEGCFPTSFGYGLVKYTADVCPGFLLTQPAILEAAEACAVPDGEVEAYYPDGESTILAARMIAKGAVNQFQMFRLKQSESK